MPRRLSSPLHALPFAAPIENALESEFSTLPRRARAQALRKCWQREGLLHATGQARRRTAQVPAGVRRLLWVNTWTTVGDAVMDLAARSLVPAAVELDLCVAPALAPLFRPDGRFARVFDDPAACGSGHDFVLLDALSTASIRLKRRHFPALPFATLRGHLLGERFDRAAFGSHRIRQLFGLAPGPVVAPWLSVAAPGVERQSRVAVALGARVDAKRYRHWSDVLGRVDAAWPAQRAPLRFRLTGAGPTAREDLQTFAPAFLADRCDVAVDRDATLRDAADGLASCAAFVGVDGGLMHIAVGVGLPGLAVFAADTDPAFFLRPESPVHALRAPASLAALSAAVVADRVLERLVSIGVGEAAQGRGGDLGRGDVADVARR